MIPVANYLVLFSSGNIQVKTAWSFVVRSIKAILLKETVCPFHIQETWVILSYSVSDFVRVLLSSLQTQNYTQLLGLEMS
jgi:hypothetical protein